MCVNMVEMYKMTKVRRNETKDSVYVNYRCHFYWFGALLL